MTDPDATAVTPPRGRSLLELVGLSGVTIAQPVLATFGDAPDFFVFHEASRTDIVLFALLIAAVPGLLAWLLSQIVGLVSYRGRGLVHHLALGTFAALGVLQITAQSDISLWLGVPLAMGASLALILGRLRWAGFRSWLGWLAPAPVLFVSLFLFVAPVSNLVSGTDIDPADLGTFGSTVPPPVVVMVFDEWPLSSIVRTDGTIDEQVAPNVARLVESATWYRDTVTVANITNFAVPAILTGNMPEPGDRADASSQPENLFTLLAGSYDLEVTESLTRLCPETLCAKARGGRSADDRTAQLGGLLGEAGDVFTDRLTPGTPSMLVTDAYVEPEGAVREAETDDGTLNLEELLAPRPERLKAFIDGFNAGEDPTVHYVHVLGPHTPHRHTPAGVRYPSDSSLRLISAPDGSPGSDLRADVAWPAQLDRQRLLLEVGHIDRLIGEVLDQLEETGLYDDALVVLTSDHGLGFEPGASARGLGDRAVERSIEPDLLWVPLIIKAPGQTGGGVSDIPARTIDILPTMAGHLGIDLPWAVDGLDLGATGDGAGPADTEGTREFVRIEGSSFAAFNLDPPVSIRADLAEVFTRGTDAHLDGSGEDRWWRVGPRPDLVGARVGDLQLGSVSDSLHQLDQSDADVDVDLASGEAPLLIAGRIESDGAPRPGAGPVAVLVGDVIAAVVPTYNDGTGPGRFAAMLAPRFFEETDGVVRIADVTDQNGETVLRLIPEA